MAFAIQPGQEGYEMFRAHLRLVLRTMARHRGYTTISIAGLALALACAFLMLLFITFETSYDR